MSPQQWNEERWEEIEPGVYRRRSGPVGEAGTGTQSEIQATEAAVKLAEENSVDLAVLQGTGAEGRITVDDVRAVVTANEEAAAAATDDTAGTDDTASEAPVAEVQATGAAEKLAAESGIDLATIEGTGAEGRITVGDVKAAVAAAGGGDLG